METENIMRVEEDVVLREIAGDYYLIPTGKTMQKCKGLVHLQPMEIKFWNILQQGASMEDMVHTMLAEYEVQEKTLREDIQDFADKLSDNGILVKDE